MRTIDLIPAPSPIPTLRQQLDRSSSISKLPQLDWDNHPARVALARAELSGPTHPVTLAVLQQIADSDPTAIHTPSKRKTRARADAPGTPARKRKPRADARPRKAKDRKRTLTLAEGRKAKGRKARR